MGDDNQPLSPWTTSRLDSVCDLVVECAVYTVGWSTAKAMLSAFGQPMDYHQNRNQMPTIGGACEAPCKFDELVCKRSVHSFLLKLPDQNRY